jgi:5'-deoxynucleotidase YfbR-like HD superfamily hydrolase
MGRHKIYTDEQIKQNRALHNKANYNRILAAQSDKKRFVNSLDIIERFLDGVEKLNKVKESKITVETTKLEQLLKKAKAINMSVKIEADVRKMMSEKIEVELRSLPQSGEAAAESTAKEEQQPLVDSLKAQK